MGEWAMFALVWVLCGVVGGSPKLVAEETRRRLNVGRFMTRHDWVRKGCREGTGILRNRVS